MTNQRHSPFVNGDFIDVNQLTGKYTKVISGVYQAIDGIESASK